MATYEALQLLFQLWQIETRQNSVFIRIPCFRAFLHVFFHVSDFLWIPHTASPAVCNSISATGVRRRFRLTRSPVDRVLESFVTFVSMASNLLAMAST